MSPILPPPPPAGISTPTDDWTDDPSFDLSLSPTLAQGIQLPSSPSSSIPHSRSHSHSSSSSKGSRGMTSSPLRQIHTSNSGGKASARRKIEEEAEDDGFDFPDDLDVGDEAKGGTVKLSSGQTVFGKKGIGLDVPKRRASGDGGGFDFPDDLEVDDDEGGTLKLAPAASSKAPRKGMGTISLSGTVIGVGPKGVGTITRLGQPVGSSGAVKPRSSGHSKPPAKPDFDLDDLDNLFDEAGPSTFSLAKRLPSANDITLPLSSNRVIAPPNALDDLDIDFDDELDDAIIAEEEDQATLKAGATIKALLPPPRPRPSHSTATPKATTRSSEEDSEMDLVLPLSMTNLTLATVSSRVQSSSSKHLKPRASTSTIRSDWDSPSSGSGPGSASKAVWDDSPWGKRPRPSETSGTTSISEDIGTPHRKGRAVEVEVEGEEEGEEMMMGLVLPEQGFFEGRREGELNRILDRKRRPQDAFVPAGQNRQGRGKRTGTEEKGAADESMEDGLLFDDPGKELTGHRLRQQKKVRGLAGGTIKKGSLGKEGGKPSAAESWEKAREAGWGRHTPLPAASREKERGSGGLGLAGMAGSGASVGHRSHSATAMGIIGGPQNSGTPASRDFSSASAMAGLSSHPHRQAQFPHPSSSRRDTDGYIPDRESAPRTRTQSMVPPPIPPPATPSSRLRHQKSHYQVSAPSPSPTHGLPRKQSLPSFQEGLTHSAPADSTASTPQKDRYHSSTSRLTMGTSSSRAKVRPPISAIFPRSDAPSGSGGMNGNTSASSSSASISGLARGPTPSGHRTQPPAQLQSQMVVPLGGRRRGLPGEKKRTWGDGTELEGIEDLEVEEPSVRSGNGIGLGKPNRKGDSLGRSAVPPPKPTAESEKRKKSNGGSVSKRRPRKAAGLIKHLGTVDKKKVVGDMTWNPATLRWEGNESILRDFDSPSGTPTTSAPARPALITHYTGGVVAIPSSSSSTSASGSGLSLTASTIRIVGDMKFDPERMCWVSIGDEEPDPFADMADDEDDEGGGGGATITRASGRKLVSVGQGLGASAGSGWSSRLASESSAGGSVMSWEERVRVRKVDRDDGEGSISEELWRECKDAEERHRKEMKGWGMGRAGEQISREERRDRERREEKRLWEIRYLAMRS